MRLNVGSRRLKINRYRCVRKLRSFCIGIHNNLPGHGNEFVIAVNLLYLCSLQKYVQFLLR